MNAKSLANHLSRIATLATFAIACVEIFSQTIVLEQLRLSGKNKVNSELTTEFARMWDDRLMVLSPERSPEFQTNLQDEFLRRVLKLQNDFIRRAFEQLFAPFAAGVIGNLQFNRYAATQGLRGFLRESTGLRATLVKESLGRRLNVAS
ncbi:MAG: hypothetical protein WB586_16540 [Chthoniobacterales bacterium]